MLILALLVSAGCVFAQAQKRDSQAKSSPSARKKATKTPSRKAAKKRKRSRRPRGQQQIQADRVRQIQQALIEAKYLQGEPSGVWDDRTRIAMARFQADNGWQTKVLPDSRALIKLGLGPDQSHLINPDTAVTASAPAGPGRQ